MLATSWEAVNDTTWIFHLRKGVKFHNGEEFNAEAVRFSIDRVLNPATKARWRANFTFIDRVDIVDPFTVKIITKTPAPLLITNLGFGMLIVPPEYFKEKGDDYIATHPIGTGPFKFVRWVKDDEVVFEANENYWAGSPKIKTVVFKPIPEDSTRVAALLGGDVDIVKKVPIHLIPMVNKSKVAKVIVVPSAQGICCPIDTLKKGPLQDKRVRQAINYAVDKESIIKNVLEGTAPLWEPR
jgi:peptide/nickel transport system substrate-binding protein